MTDSILQKIRSLFASWDTNCGSEAPLPPVCYSSLLRFSPSALSASYRCVDKSFSMIIGKNFDHTGKNALVAFGMGGRGVKRGCTAFPCDVGPEGWDAQSLQACRPELPKPSSRAL